MDAQRVNFSDVVWAEIEAHGPPRRSRLEIHGPDVRLLPYQAQALALALHELLTNAVKHGALHEPTGRLSITWETWAAARGGQRLALLWQESGVPLTSEVACRSGHGRHLIEESLRSSLQADTQWVLGDDGVWCRIELPVEDARLAVPR
jgi:two-component sensor histidine kinase